MTIQTALPYGAHTLIPLNHPSQPESMWRDWYAMWWHANGSKTDGTFRYMTREEVEKAIETSQGEVIYLEEITDVDPIDLADEVNGNMTPGSEY